MTKCVSLAATVGPDKITPILVLEMTLYTMFVAHSFEGQNETKTSLKMSTMGKDNNVCASRFCEFSLGQQGGCGGRNRRAEGKLDSFQRKVEQMVVISSL